MDKPAEDTVPDVNAALEGFMPQIRAISREGGLVIALIIVAGLGAMYVFRNTGDHPSKILIMLAFVMAGLCIFVTGWVRRRHEALIMPFLAQTAGLTFSPTAKEFISRLPQRLLPKANVRAGEDLLYGLIGDRHIEMAEVKYETGGKNSTTLFQGIVLAFPNVAPLPPFFIAPETQTQKRFLMGARIQVDDLVRIGSRIGGDVAFGVWASAPSVADDPALGAVLKTLIELKSVVGPQANLFSATSNGQIVHVALSHKRDLFRMGGLFADSEQLMTTFAKPTPT